MAPTGRARIFVVEDEAVIAIDLRERLTALGYEVCGIALHGETAAEEIARLRPDLVLMDVNLSGSMDGVDLARRLGEQVAVVFLTAYSDSELIARAALTNAYGYLVKPFEEREVHATLQMALARHASQRVLRDQVVIDALTGLYNRRFLDGMLLTEVRRARREGKTLSVAMIDIDHFKKLNDTHGHEAGDLVLKWLASTFRGNVRATDLTCRYGGDEFTVVMPGVNAVGAARKMRSVCAVIRKGAVDYRGGHLKFTVSAGVAEMPPADGTPEDLLAGADAALLRSKREGRDRVSEAETRPDES